MTEKPTEFIHTIVEFALTTIKRENNYRIVYETANLSEAWICVTMDKVFS